MCKIAIRNAGMKQGIKRASECCKQTFEWT